MNWEKIDKFYIILAVVLVLMAVMVIFSFRGVFGAFLTAYDFDQNEIGQEAMLDEDKIEEAYNFVFDKNPVSLAVRD